MYCAIRVGYFRLGCTSVNFSHRKTLLDCHGNKVVNDSQQVPLARDRGHCVYQSETTLLHIDQLETVILSGVAVIIQNEKIQFGDFFLREPAK